MFSNLTIFSFLLAAVSVHLDKVTQFSHPSLHLMAFIGMLGVAYSLLATA